jgi:predicted transcriptional regulator
VSRRKPKIPVTVRLDPAQKRRAQEIAAARGETLTEVVEQGLDRYIARHSR